MATRVILNVLALPRPNIKKVNSLNYCESNPGPLHLLSGRHIFPLLTYCYVT